MTTKCVYATGQQSTKHLLSCGSGLGSCNKRVQYPWPNCSPGPDLSVHTVAVVLAGAHTSSEGGGLISLPTASLLHLRGNQAITEQGARVLFPGSVTSFYLLVTKESLVTNTCHPGIWVTILPCITDSHFGNSEHSQCIQHKICKNIAIIRIFYVPGTVQSPLQRLLLNPHNNSMSWVSVLL